MRRETNGTANEDNPPMSSGRYELVRMIGTSDATSIMASGYERRTSKAVHMTAPPYENALYRT